MGERNRAKRLAAVTVALFIVFIGYVLMNRGKPPLIAVEESESRCVSVTAEGGKVVYRCEVTLVNSGKKAEVRLYAACPEDEESGVLKESDMKGTDEAGERIFTLESGKTTVTVLFEGEAGGTPPAAGEHALPEVAVEYIG